VLSAMTVSYINHDVVGSPTMTKLRAGAYARAGPPVT
jgi:hypothetical protein